MKYIAIVSAFLLAASFSTEASYRKNRDKIKAHQAGKTFQYLFTTVAKERLRSSNDGKIVSVTFQQQQQKN